MKPAGRLSLRQGALAAALAATLLATWWASQVDDTEPPLVPARPAAVGAAPAAAADSASGHRTWSAAGAGLIAGPPPPPPAAAVEAPAMQAEQAPPLPFRFVGTVGEPGRGFVLLFNGQDVITAGTGERIDEQYRVTRITPSRIEFIHLPTRQRQALEIADYDQQQK